MGNKMRVLALQLGFVFMLVQPLATYAAEPGKFNVESIERLTGAKGTLNEKEGVFKVSVPRDDLNITVADVTMIPPMGLTSWAAFTKVGGHTMVMGDNVLLETQVAAVMDAALQNGLDVTALHNHFFWDSPKVMFMHVSRMGDEEKLAVAIGAVFAAITETSLHPPQPPLAKIDPSHATLDPKPIEDILGAKGDFKKGVLKFTWGKKTKMGGHEMGSAMGANTWAAFTGGNEKAVVDGDFAMYESELQGVLKALRHAGINVVAIHNHMTGETPRVVFLHYWGVGSTTDLARGLKSALGTQK